MALKLAEMNAFVQKRQAEDDRLQQEIQDTFRELSKSVLITYWIIHLYQYQYCPINIIMSIYQYTCTHCRVF